MRFNLIFLSLIKKKKKRRRVEIHCRHCLNTVDTCLQSCGRAEIISFNSVYYLIFGSTLGWIICYCFLMDVNFRKDALEECNTIDVMC